MRAAVASLAFLSAAACTVGDPATGPHNTSVGGLNADEAITVSAECTPPSGSATVQVDMVPGSSTNTIGFSSRQAEITFAILGSATFDASKIDPTTVTVGDGCGTDTPLVRDRKGKLKYVLTDVNGDFKRDFYGYASKSAMKLNGDLTLSTTSLTVMGAATDPAAATPVLFAGTDKVNVVP